MTKKRFFLWLILFVLFGIFAFRAASAETVYQKFEVGGAEFYAEISTSSLSFLREQNQAPEIVWQNFGGLWSFVKISALFWKKAEAEELPIKDVISNYITYWANQRGIPADRVLKIATCESRLNVYAYNPKDTDNFPKYGIFQFHKPTFYGEGGENIYDWQEQTRIATGMMARGLWMKWPYCYKQTL
jgi:hypothetical protein